MKKCSVCKLEKPLTDYRKDKSRKDGIHKTCNSCNASIQRDWYQRNKAKAQANANKRYQENKEAISAKRKQDRKNNPEKYKTARKKQYSPTKRKEYAWKRAGIKDMDYDRYLLMLEKQNHCCDICNKHISEINRTHFDVDHDHNTGKVRGLLCTQCNSGIGKLQDSVSILSAALNYLKRYE